MGQAKAPPQGGHDPHAVDGHCGEPIAVDDGRPRRHGFARDASDAWDLDARDPLARVFATAISPHGAGPASAAETAPAAQALPSELEQMLVRLAKRAHWGGDGRRATARIELDAGAWQGAILTVHAGAARDVSVEIELPSGVASSAWGERIKARLEQRGFAVSEVAVH